MRHDLDCFIDTHCHMFTIADIPLYQTVKHAVGSLHPITGMLLGALAGTKVGNKQLKKHWPLISFFEAEAEENPARIQREMADALKSSRIRAGEVVTTPLVMDFDVNGKVTKLDDQVERLVWAAQQCPEMRVLPFLGTDPRKFVYHRKNAGSTPERFVYDTERVVSKSEMTRRFDEFLLDFDVKSRAKRKDITQLENGDILGIKMYPPLGFPVFPDEARAQERHLDLYERFCDKGLPVTAHCQKTSFSFVAKKDVIAFTKPQNWHAVLDGLAQRGKHLRLNFGHYGGDSGLAELSFEDDWKAGERLEVRKLRKASWTYQIAKALCQYPNTYADISAIEFKNTRHASNFLSLLAFDHAGKLNWGPHKLLDKLMWGSDYPMALGAAPTYDDVLSDFLTAYVEVPNKSRKTPEAEDLPPLKEVVRKLCCDNPRRFLFGT